MNVVNELLLGKFTQDGRQIVAVWSPQESVKLLLLDPHTGELKEVYAYTQRLAGGQQ